jgi:hypothetical protein
MRMPEEYSHVRKFRESLQLVAGQSGRVSVTPALRVVARRKSLVHLKHIIMVTQATAENPLPAGKNEQTNPFCCKPILSIALPGISLSGHL